MYILLEHIFYILSNAIFSSIVSDDSVVFETTSVTRSKSNITRLTPRSTPGISDLPFVFSIETNKDDSVISFFGIRRAVFEGTTSIERPARGINANGNRLNLNGSL